MHPCKKKGAQDRAKAAAKLCKVWRNLNVNNRELYDGKP